jgi:Ca2+/Na+ antiporter
MDQIFIALAKGYEWLATNMSLGLAGKIFSLLLIIWMIIEFIKAQADKLSPIDLNDLFIDGSGKIGGSKMRLNMAFIVTTWILIYYTLQGQLSEWLFAAYIAAFVYDRVNSRQSDPGALNLPAVKPIPVPVVPAPVAPAAPPAPDNDDPDIANLPDH